MNLAFRTGAVFLAFYGSVIIGAAAGFTLYRFGPCSWFGSPFEGQCEVGALGVALILFYSLAATSFIALLWFFFKYKPSVPFAPRGATPPPRLYAAWVALLVLQYLVPAVVRPENLMVYAAVWLSPLIGFVVVSYLLAPYRGCHRTVSLLAFAPVVGAFAVGVLLLKDRSRLLGAADHGMQAESGALDAR